MKNVNTFKRLGAAALVVAMTAATSMVSFAGTEDVAKDKAASIPATEITVLAESENLSYSVTTSAAEALSAEEYENLKNKVDWKKVVMLDQEVIDGEGLEFKEVVNSIPATEATKAARIAGDVVPMSKIIAE